MKKNITLDFSGNKSMDAMLAGQPLAIMPAELAKKLLKIYANTLMKADATDIINDHITDLHMAAVEKDLNTAMRISLDWMQERYLIEHVMSDNWDIYAVEQETIHVDKYEDRQPMKDVDISELVKAVDVRPKEEGPNVLGKIDLSSIPSSTRAKLYP